MLILTAAVAVPTFVDVSPGHCFICCVITACPVVTVIAVIVLILCVLCHCHHVLNDMIVTLYFKHCCSYTAVIVIVSVHILYYPSFW